MTIRTATLLALPHIDPVRLYLADIHRFPLLTAQDEVRLGRLVVAGHQAAAELAHSGDDILPGRRSQLDQMVDEAERAVQQIVEANLRLVVAVAKRYRRSSLPLPDLIQEGNLGLLHAARRFDYRRGFRFSTSATGWISQAIARAIATKSRTIRLPLPLDRSLALVRPVLGCRPAAEPRSQWLERVTAMTGLSADQVDEAERHVRDVTSLSESLMGDDTLLVGDVVADPAAEAQFRGVEMQLVVDLVRDLLSLLNEREREVVQLRFGIDAPRRHTLEEVGQRYGLSQERVRQIEARALLKLRHPALRRDIGSDFLATA